MPEAPVVLVVRGSSDVFAAKCRGILRDLGVEPVLVDPEALKEGVAERGPLAIVIPSEVMAAYPGLSTGVSRASGGPYRDGAEASAPSPRIICVESEGLDAGELELLFEAAVGAGFADDGVELTKQTADR